MFGIRKYEVKFYKKSNGVKPYDEWFESLKDSLTKARIEKRMRRLAVGNFGDYKTISASDIYELRLAFGPGIRIYFGMDGKNIIVILAGGDKASQNRDINKAKEYWCNYWEEDYER